MVSGKINLVFVPWDGTAIIKQSPNPTIEMTDALSERLQEINEGGFNIKVYVKRREEDLPEIGETAIYADMCLSLREDYVQTNHHSFLFETLMDDTPENIHQKIFMKMRPPFVKLSFFPSEGYEDDYSCAEDIPIWELNYEEIKEHLYFNSHNAWRGPITQLFFGENDYYYIEVDNRQTSSKTKDEILAMDIHQIADWVKHIWRDDI